MRTWKSALRKFFVHSLLTLLFIALGAVMPDLDRHERLGSSSFFITSVLAQGAGPLPSTIEADSSDRYVLELAGQLAFDPDLIFAYVRDEVANQPYVGSLRGARGTIWTHAGNSLDKASLLVALLRASGYRANYVRGTLDDASAQALLQSAFRTPLRVVGCLGPESELADPIADPQQIQKVRDHFWVEAEVGTTTRVFDPSFSAGSAPSSAIIDRFDAVPVGLQHTVNVRLQVETSGIGLANGQRERVALDEQFAAAALVGRPLSVGHFVDSQVQGSLVGSLVRHTYSPYVFLGEHDGAVAEDEVLRGSDYEEIAGSGIVTLVQEILTRAQVEVELVSPDGSATIERRDLLDRIGHAARRSPTATTLDNIDVEQPAFSELDITTFYINPGLQLADALALQRDRLKPVSDQVQALQSSVEQIVAAGGPATPSEERLIEQANSASRQLSIAQNETVAMLYAVSADGLLAQVQQGFLTLGFYATPRIIVTDTRVDGVDSTLGIDILRNKLEAIEHPGQLAGTSFLFEMTRGLVESQLEDTLLEAVTGQSVTSPIDVFGALDGTDIDVAIIDQDNAFEIDNLDLSAQARSRIASAVENGKVVITPSSAVEVDGEATIGWLEVDGITGHTISVDEHGRHAALVGYTSTFYNAASSAGAFVAGLGQGFSVGILSFIGEFLGNLNNGVSPFQAMKNAKVKVIEKTIAEIIKKIFSNSVSAKGVEKAAITCGFGIGLSGKPPSFSAIAKCAINYAISLVAKKNKLSFVVDSFKYGVIAGLVLSSGYLYRTLPVDPPAFPYLSGDLAPLPSPGSFGSSPGLSLGSELDPLFTLPVNDVELPTAHILTIGNTGNTPDGVDLEVSGLPDGYLSSISLSSLHELAPGERRQVGLCVMPGPDASVPPAGTDLTVTLIASSQNDPGIVQTMDVTSPIPPIADLSIDMPAREFAVPGNTVSIAFTINALGNQALDVDYVLDDPSARLNPTLDSGTATLLAGQSQSLTFQVSIPADAVPGQQFDLTIAAEASGAESEQASIVIDIIEPGLGTIGDSARLLSDVLADAELGGEGALNPVLRQLAERDEFNRLLEALSQTRSTPTDPAAIATRQQHCERAARFATNIASGLRANRHLSDFAASFDSIAAAARSCGPGLLPSLPVVALGEFLVAVNEQLEFNFEATLVPPSRLVQPGAATTVEVELLATGNKAVEIAIAVGEADTELNVVPPLQPIVLTPGQRATVPVELQANAPGAFAYRLQILPTDPSDDSALGSLEQELNGTVSSSQSWLNVTRIAATPRFLIAGQPVQLEADIVNSANIAQQAYALSRIIDPAGVERYRSAPAVSVDIPTGNRPDPYFLDNVDTSGWENGSYRILTQLVNEQGDPIPGVVGEGIVQIGAPVEASFSLAKTVLPPGDHEVDTHLDVTRLVGGTTVSSGFVPTPLDDDRVNWATAPNGASSTHLAWGSRSFAHLFDEVPNGLNAYTDARTDQDNYLQIDLGAVRAIDGIWLHLYDGDYRFFRYRVEASVDGLNFTTIIDRSTGEHRGLQKLDFALRDARYIRIVGLHSSLNNRFHLINDVLVMGPVGSSEVGQLLVEIDGINDAAATYSGGKRIRLNAGVYEVRYAGGAISPFAAGTANENTWEGRYRIDVPGINREYYQGWTHAAFSQFETSQAAESRYLGEAFTIDLPVQADVWFWYPDSAPADNRGQVNLQVRQLSGYTDSVLPQVRDAIVRSVAWEQRDLAAWDNWGTRGSAACFGCHIQSQGVAGLSEAERKLPDLPIDPALIEHYVESLETGWHSSQPRTRGWICRQNNSCRGSEDITNTSLGVWSFSDLLGRDPDRLEPLLSESLQYLESIRVDAFGGRAWNADHRSSDAAKLYFDGDPSATLTAGNIQAIARGLEAGAFTGIVQAQGDASGNIDMQRSPPNIYDIAVSATNVHAVRLEVNETFAPNSNSVLTEIEFFDGDTQIPVVAGFYNVQQGGYPLSESFDGVLTGDTNGWAHVNWNIAATPAIGIWRFEGPVNITRVRLWHNYTPSDHTYESFQLLATLDAGIETATSFAEVSAAFEPIDILGVSTTDVSARMRLMLQEAAATLYNEAFPFERNVRTAAQSLIGLDAALPYLGEQTERPLAQARIDEIVTWLRAQQQGDGGWIKTGRETFGSQPFQTAQALEALLRATTSSVDPAIIAATEFLIDSQRPDGSWQSVDLQKFLAATTWVEIALPTLFERLSALTVEAEENIVTSAEQTLLQTGFAPIEPDQSDVANGVALKWQTLFDDGNTERYSARVALNGLQPGEVHQIASGARVSYASVEGSGAVDLPALYVSVQHILSIDPASRDVVQGQRGVFSVTIENLLDIEDSFDLRLSGLPTNWVALPGPVSVPAGQSVSFDLAVDVPRDADLG